MTDQTQATSGASFYHVPATVQDMLAPKPSSLITEAANFLRSHWDEVKPYYQVLSGEVTSTHGARDLDEAACVFKVQALAEKNGFAFLGSVQAATLRRALRFGFKRNTGVPLATLIPQYKQRLLEDRRH